MKKKWFTAIAAVTVAAATLFMLAGCDSENSEKDSVPDYFILDNSGTILMGVDKTKCPAKVTIPEGVTTINDDVFSYFTPLESVVIPSGVTKIGSSVFFGCTSLASVSIPDTVTEIGNLAFSGCTNLTIHYSGTEAEWESISLGFQAIPSDTDVKFKSTVSGGSTSGGNQGSGEEKQDGYLTIKGGVVIKCDPAAEGYISVPTNVTAIGDRAFIGCSKIEVIKMQSGVTTIGTSAFEGCTSLNSIEIPASVTSIGSGAFSYCSKLTTVNFAGTPSQLSKLRIDAKSVNTTTATVTCNYGKTNAVLCHFGECLTITSEESYDLVTECDATVRGYVIIPSNVAGIDIEAFKDCTGITGVIIPDGVMLIDEEAFSGCTNLAYIEIPGSVVSVGRSVFDDCDNLKEINYTGTIANYAETDFNVGSIFPNIASVTINGKRINEITEIIATDLAEVTTIGSQAFRGWNGLRSVTIPNSVRTLDYGAFADCTSLTSVTLPGSLASIGTYAFENCTSLTSIEIPNGIETIEYGAFYGCTNLSSVKIASSVTTIQRSAFYDCTSLTALILPSSVTSIGRSAFTTSTGMTVNYAGTIGTWVGVTINTSRGGSPSGGSSSDMDMPGSGGSRGDYNPYPLFSSGDKVILQINGRSVNEITEITAADLTGVTEIREYAFFAWKGLQTVTIPSDIFVIYGYAFAECTALTSITMQGSDTNLDEWCFYKVPATMYVPKGDKTNYENQLESSQFSWSYDESTVTVTVEEQL